MTKSNTPPTVEEAILSQYPDFAFDVSEDTQQQFDRIFSPKHITSFARSIGLDDVDARDLLLAATDTYIGGVLERINQRSEKQDNAALTKVANKAQQLEEALLDLLDYPNLEPQLERQIRGFHALAEGPDGTTLSDLLGTRRNVFGFFQEMLIDLQTCAEDTRNLTPKKEDFIDSPAYGDRDNALKEYNRAVAATKQRSQDRRLNADHPLQCFLLVIHPTWVSHSSHPFTEGMHYTEAKGTISPLVSALWPVLHAIDGAITPQRIVSTIRSMRKNAKFLGLS